MGIRAWVDRMTRLVIWRTNGELIFFVYITSPGAYVRVVGNMREYQGRFSVTAHTIRLIPDMNELTYHNLEVMVVHASFTRSKVKNDTENSFLWILLYGV